MNKQQKLKIALPILAGLMFVVWKPILMGAGPRNKDHGKRNSGSSQVSAPPEFLQSDLALLLGTGQKKRARSTFQEWDRNPFVLGQKQDALMVEGILWGDQDPKVMINGNILGNGEQLGNVTVIEIKPNTVILKGDKGEVELGPGGTL